MFFYLFLLSLVFFGYYLFIKDPKIEWRAKIFHLVINFYLYISGFSSKSKIHNRYLADLLLFKPKTYEKDGVKSEDLKIPNYKQDGKFVNIRIFRNKFQIQQPLVIFIHGGGYAIGYSLTYELMLRGMSKKGMNIISIDYSLAPEQPFPYAVHECFSVLKWIKENIEKKENKDDLLFHPSKIVICGDSAGGNLSAVMCMMNRDENLDLPISKQVLIYPVFHIDPPLDSVKRYDYYILTPELREFCISSYLKGHKKEEIYENPLLNPLKSKNGVKGLPKCFIITAEFDPLKDEGLFFLEELKKNNIEVQHMNFYTVHEFLYSPYMKYSAKAFKSIVNYILE